MILYSIKYYNTVLKIKETQRVFKRKPKRVFKSNKDAFLSSLNELDDILNIHNVVAVISVRIHAASGPISS